MRGRVRLKVLAFDGVGELSQWGLAEVFAAADADLACRWGATCAQRAAVAVGAGEARDARSVRRRPARAQLVDLPRLGLRAGDGLGFKVDLELAGIAVAEGEVAAAVDHAGHRRDPEDLIAQRDVAGDRVRGAVDVDAVEARAG